MINAKSAVLHLGFDGVSSVRAVQEVREKVMNSSTPLKEAIHIIHSITAINKEYTDIALALHVAQVLVMTAVREDMFDPEVTIAEGEAKDAHLRKHYSWIFETASEFSRASSTDVQVSYVEGLDVKVSVKADGSLKKGSKGVLAEELWKKFMLVSAPLSNGEFVVLLQKQAQFTKSGASTYAYNMKKKFGVGVSATA